MEFYMCEDHGYAYRPNDPDYYLVINPPPVDTSKLCSKCTAVMKKRETDMPTFIGSKIWYHILDDATRRKLMVGQYTYLRYKKE